LLSPTVLLRRKAVTKGLFGGNRGWMAVGAALWGPRLMRKLFGRNEEIIATERLVAGEAIRLEALRPPTRKQRRAARSAS
jgi:hypothetical protein